jgi:hypothetical protein
MSRKEKKLPTPSPIAFSSDTLLLQVADSLEKEMGPGVQNRLPQKQKLAAQYSDQGLLVWLTTNTTD